MSETSSSSSSLVGAGRFFDGATDSVSRGSPLGIAEGGSAAGRLSTFSLPSFAATFLPFYFTISTRHAS